MKSGVPKFVIIILQILAYFTVGPILRIWNFAKIVRTPTIGELKPGSVIASNHQSYFDPFIVLGALPFFTFVKALPYRFPTCREVMSHRRSFLIKWLGAFDIGVSKKDRMLALFYTRELIKDKQTILIFPEGAVSESEEILQFQGGIKFLKDLAASLLFVRLSGFQNSERFNPFRKRAIIFSDVKSMGMEEQATESLRIFLQSVQIQ